MSCSADLAVIGDRGDGLAAVDNVLDRGVDVGKVVEDGEWYVFALAVLDQVYCAVLGCEVGRKLGGC